MKKHKKTFILISGGLDSSILLSQLLEKYDWIQPVYIRSQNQWEEIELFWLKRFLRVLRNPKLKPLIILDFPLSDVYENLWSITGKKIPGAYSKDEAVYLPGKNIVLLAKTAILASQKKIHDLALAPLKTNPFPDAKRSFFTAYEKVLTKALAFQIRIRTPFLALTKKQVMTMGRNIPLQFTFSCLNPKGKLHCGRCNKCVERKRAFREAEMHDSTRYSR